MAQLRPAVGNYLTTDWSWKFATRPCWCLWSYSPRTFKAQYQGLDWAQYKGLCTQIGLHSWLAKPPPIPWGQAGGRSFERWWREPSVPQHEAPRWVGLTNSSMTDAFTTVEHVPKMKLYYHTNLVNKPAVLFQSNNLQQIYLELIWKPLKMFQPLCNVLSILVRPLQGRLKMILSCL